MKPLGNQPLGRMRKTQEDNIKNIDLKEMGCNDGKGKWQRKHNLILALWIVAILSKLMGKTTLHQLPSSRRGKQWKDEWISSPWTTLKCSDSHW